MIPKQACRLRLRSSDFSNDDIFPIRIRGVSVYRRNYPPRRQIGIKRFRAIRIIMDARIGEGCRQISPNESNVIPRINLKEHSFGHFQIVLL